MISNRTNVRRRTRAGAADSVDPAFAVIDAYLQADRLNERLTVELDSAEQKIGQRQPSSLIAWREYGAVGGDEIDAARATLLARGDVPAEQIEREYRAAKKRYRAARTAGDHFDQRHGIAELRKRTANSLQAYFAARDALVNVVPTTPTGLAALFEFIRTQTIEVCGGESFLDPDEHVTLLRAIEAAMRTMFAANAAA